MAHSRSEVVLSTDPARLARSPEDVRLLSPSYAPSEEVIPSSPAPTDQTRVVGVGLVDRAEMERRRNARLKAARNVHRIYGADR